MSPSSGADRAGPAHGLATAAATRTAASATRIANRRLPPPTRASGTGERGRSTLGLSARPTLYTGVPSTRKRVLWAGEP